MYLWWNIYDNYLITYESLLYLSLFLIMNLPTEQKFPWPWSPPITISILDNLLSKLSLSIIVPNLLNNDLVNVLFNGLIIN